MKTIRKIELKWNRVPLVKDEEAVYETQVRNSTDVMYIAKALIENEVHEVVIAIHLNNKNKVVGYNEVSRGGIAGASVTSADVFRSAIIMGATKIILAHNHPSGDPSPSEEDIKLTKRIKEAGKILKVHLLDHIIIGDKSYRSLTDSGIL